jgi:hypothetical protein
VVGSGWVVGRASVRGVAVGGTGVGSGLERIAHDAPSMDMIIKTPIILRLFLRLDTRFLLCCRWGIFANLQTLIIKITDIVGFFCCKYIPQRGLEQDVNRRFSYQFCYAGSIEIKWKPFNPDQIQTKGDDRIEIWFE